MDAQGVVVLPGQGPEWTMSPGRSAVLKLLGGATGGSIMMFEETVPGGLLEAQQRTRRTIASMSEGEVAELRERHGWEIVGPSPL